MTAATFSQALRIDPSPFVRRDGKAPRGLNCRQGHALRRLHREDRTRRHRAAGRRGRARQFVDAKLSVRWREGRTTADAIVASRQRTGLRGVPLRSRCLIRHDDEEGRFLLRCLAVAGFAASNVMFLSISIWAGLDGEMGEGTRTMLHWISGLIAVPAALYAGRPFFRSAFASLARGRANMDVPIGLAILWRWA